MFIHCSWLESSCAMQKRKGKKRKKQEIKRRYCTNSVPHIGATLSE
jgi:hypothetical protein